MTWLHVDLVIAVGKSGQADYVLALSSLNHIYIFHTMQCSSEVDSVLHDLFPAAKTVNNSLCCFLPDDQIFLNRNGC